MVNMNEGTGNPEPSHTTGYAYARYSCGCERYGKRRVPDDCPVHHVPFTTYIGPDVKVDVTR